MYDSIDADVHGELIAYQGPYWDVQLYVGTYLTDLLYWFGEQGRAVLIVVVHSIRSNPSMMNSEYPNMKVVFLHGTSITVSPLQLSRDRRDVGISCTTQDCSRVRHHGTKCRH